MLRNLKLLASFATLALLAGILPALAAAHEHREVADGRYALTVGFLHEPAFVDQQNGLSLRVVKLGGATPAADAGTPVAGLTDTLTAEVTYGDQAMALELEPVFNDPGHYQAIFFPTAPGAYTFHISGEIEGTPIDETFEPGPETFDEVQPIEPLQFPKPDA
jgi:hypothetical protein